MAEQSSNPTQPTESTLALSFLREDIQDLRQDVRQIHERIDQTNGRIDGLRTEPKWESASIRPTDASSIYPNSSIRATRG